MAPFTGNIKVYQMWIWKLWHALRTSMTICSLWRTETIRSYKSRVSRPLCSRTWFWSPWSIQWHGRWLHLQAEQLHPDKKRLATTRPPRAVQDRDYIDYIYKLSDSFHLKSHQKKKSKVSLHCAQQNFFTTLHEGLAKTLLCPPHEKSLGENGKSRVDLNLRFIRHVSYSWWPENIM